MNPRDADRYRQQTRLAGVGAEGQARLAAAAVLVVGAGGLGCPALTALVAVGVGRVGICDDDRVETGNLPRQTLFGDADVGRAKAEAAAERLSPLNPRCRLEVIDERLVVGNAARLLAPYQLVLDGTDDLATRFLIHDACYLLRKNLVATAIHQHDGQLLNFPFGAPAAAAPCLRCLWPSPPAGGRALDCLRAGVLGTAAGVFGALMAHEAVKTIVGLEHLRPGVSQHLELMGLDSWRSAWTRRVDCPLCGDRPTISALDPAIHPDAGAYELVWGEIADPRDYVWVDIRDREECAQVPAPDAIRVDARRLWQENVLADLAPGRAHVFFCRNGRRSRALVAGLRAEGQADVFSLRGGLEGMPGPPRT